MGRLGSAQSGGVAPQEEESPFSNHPKAVAGSDPISDPLFFQLPPTVKMQWTQYDVFMYVDQNFLILEHYPVNIYPLRFVFDGFLNR